MVEEALDAGRTGGHVPVNCGTQPDLCDSSTILTKIEPDDSHCQWPSNCRNQLLIVTDNGPVTTE